MRDGASPALPSEIQARLARAEVLANERVAHIDARIRRYADSWATLFNRIQARKIKRREALLKLWQAADELGAATAPVAACRKGCSHCCHIPVALAQAEANLIGQRIGRAPVKLDPNTEFSTAYGYSNPCTFLREGECSIHPHRPLACRLHFNLDEDELLCRLRTGETVPVPLLNTLEFQAVYAFVALGDAVGDVRSFFPRGNR